jgi:hypothetical protein
MPFIRLLKPFICWFKTFAVIGVYAQQLVCKKGFLQETCGRASVSGARKIAARRVIARLAMIATKAAAKSHVQKHCWLSGAAVIAEYGCAGVDKWREHP